MSSQPPPPPPPTDLTPKPEPQQLPAFYCRKEKSLAVLCSNFLNLYNKDGVDSIGLDDAAARLGVERRRIYDIVNILESVGVLKRKAKNQYYWNGFDAIPKALDELKEEGLKENWSTFSCSSSTSFSGENHYRGFPKPKNDLENRPSSSKSENRKEKSLGLLTQQFVKLFLCSKVELISLDDAARILLGELDDPTAMRTKIRRLYDIANVFSSMNLIKKIQHPESKRPAFKWLGFSGNCLDNASASSSALVLKEPKRRSFGTEITNTISKRCKEDKSSKEARCFSAKDEREKSLLEQQEKLNSKGFVFGPFTPANVPNQRMKNKNVGRAQDLEDLASYRPRYCNQAIGDTFNHYVSAWKSWYAEADLNKKI